MTGFRGVSVWALVCLSVGLGCADTANDAKPDKEVSAEAPENKVETILTDQPLPDEAGSMVIPLNTIWGHMIPGTQSIRLLESEHLKKLSEQERADIQDSSLVKQIYMAIKRQENRQPIGPGFAVVGSGYEALRAVSEIMERDQIPPQIFPVGTEVSLFFFTRSMGPGFQMKKVRQSKEAVSICYQLVPDDAPGVILLASTRYFAVMSLGKPAAGNHAVNMIEQPTKRKRGKYDRRTFELPTEKIICRSFTFAIESVDTEAVISK